jgi:hypothetical protein
MRGRPALVVMSVMPIVAAAAYSQEVIPPPPINPQDTGNYCIYASRIYSHGAQICVAKGNVTLGCDKGEWKVGLTKFGLDCRSENAALRPGELR